MGLTQLSTPYPVFTDKNGTPLDNGYVYFGIVYENPETSPIQVYFDPGLTQPAAQPLRTSNGYIMRNGSPAILYAADLYSVTLRDKNGALVVYAPAGYGTSPYDIAGPASAEVVIVAGIAAEVTAVAAIADDVEAVGSIAADVATVAGIAADVTAVAADAADIGVVAANIANVNTVAGISANVTTVAGIAADVTAVAADSVDIGVVAANIADVNTVAGISVDVSTVAANDANVTTVAGIAANVTTVAGIAAGVTAVAAIDSEVNTVAGIAADVVIAAANSADITNFADVYQGPYAIAPTVRTNGGPLLAGDLYFNTTTDDMWVWDGATWLAAYASLSGALMAANNLSDVDDAAIALQNLGLTATAAELNTLDGITGMASQAQAEAGTDNATLMTPLRTAQAIEALTSPGGTQTFTATGTIPSGAIVGLNLDGTVSVTSACYGDSVAVSPQSSSSAYSAAYDPVNGKVVAVYIAFGNLEAVVGTVSGLSITFGTPVVIGPASSGYTTCLYHPTSGKFVITYPANSTLVGRAIVGTVSGTTITFGTAVTYETGVAWYTSSAYDSVNDKVVISYRDEGNSNFGTAVVGTVSGTSISFGTPVVFRSANTLLTSCIYYSANGKIVIFYSDGSNSNFGTAIVGTVSGTTITFGTPVVFRSANTFIPSRGAVYDSVSGKLVVVGSNYGDVVYAYVGTVSGTSITFGVPTTLSNPVPGYSLYDASCSFDPTSGNITAVLGFYRSTSYFGAYYQLRVISDVASVGSPLINSESFQALASTNAGSVSVAVFRGTTVRAQVVDMNSTLPRIVGVAAEPIANGAEGSVTIGGGVNTEQTGLVTGVKYGLNPTTGSLVPGGLYAVGYALSATELYVTDGGL